MVETETKLRLHEALLPGLRADVRRPAYDRARLQQHTVHIGVGGFHRAHQAVYLDDLLALKDEPRWGECGLGVLPGDAVMLQALKEQDCLYTVVEKSTAAQQVRVIGSICEYLLAPADRQAAIEKLASDQTRLVSLTITEGGYFLDEGTKTFLPEHPDVQYDLRHPEAPTTWLGLVVGALEHRWKRGLAPFTLMSCDNLQGNGDVLREVVLAFTGMLNRPLERWVAEHVAFPNSMVDRITPATTPADRQALAATYGFDDAWPVMTEGFRQWVIEDHFCNGRPRWEKVGGELVTDVAPYELMKMRLLNGSHMAMAYLAALSGYTYVHEVLQDPLFASFVSAFMEEVTPVVPVIPGTSVTAYKGTLLERFANPGIHDQVTRICSEGSAKIPKWLLPSIEELMARGRSIELLSFVIASWMYYLQQTKDALGRPLEVVDARRVELQGLATAAGSDPHSMLAVRSIFGHTLPAADPFVEKVGRALAMLAKQDVASCMRHYLAAEGACA